ncbi:MAG: hypothetical protein NTW10_04100 [Bacteroidetes bacterium]|nr:hypothetical protein [Bacteroidota bacterium]
MPQPSTGHTCSVNVNAGTLTCGSLTMSATTAPENDLLNISTGTATISGASTTNGAGCQFNLTSTGILNIVGTITGTPKFSLTSTGTFNIGGSIAGLPTLSTVSGSTVNYTGASAQTIYPIAYQGNLGLSGSGVKTISNTYTSNIVVVHENFINNSTLQMSVGTIALPTYLLLIGNGVNNPGATITATANYTGLYFYSAPGQTFTNNGTITAPLANLTHDSINGLTLSGSNPIVATRVNLFKGTITNSNKITLGNGGISYATVQRGVSSNTAPAGSFDVAPSFNVGSGGLNLLYDNGSAAYTAGFEVPGSNTCYAFYIFDAADVTLGSDLTISNELNFYVGTPTLRIGAHTLTLGGVITYTVPGSIKGGVTSNLIMNGATTVNGITNGLNNFTINAKTILGGGINVNGMLTLTSGWLVNGSNLSMANGSTITRSGGSLLASPTFIGTVNLAYTGGSAIVTGLELPVGSSVLNNLATNAGGVNQHATSGTTNLLTDAFPNLTSWTGNKGSSAGQFTTSPTANAGGTSPEAEFIGSVTHGNATYSIYRGPVNTSGYKVVNVSFKSYATGNYIQNFPTYLKLQSATSASGPWHDIWSMPYAPHSATTVSIPNYSTDVGGNMYFQFAFVGDYYATDYWYFDNLVVDGLTPVASTATVNGTLDLTIGTYSIGAGNSLVLSGGLTGSSAIVGSATSNLTVSASPVVGGGPNISLPLVTGGLYNFTVSRPLGANLGSALIISGAANILNNCLLDCGSYVISGPGSFSISPGATLKTAHPSGVAGSIVLSGTKSSSIQADYVFDGSAPQVTGFFLPAEIRNLIIDNAAGVTLSSTDLIVDGDLTINSGKLFTVGTGKQVTVYGTAFLK